LNALLVTVYNKHSMLHGSHFLLLKHAVVSINTSPYLQLYWSSLLFLVKPTCKHVLKLILIFRVLSCLVQTCKTQIFRELTCEKLICVTLYVLASCPIYQGSWVLLFTVYLTFCASSLYTSHDINIDVKEWILIAFTLINSNWLALSWEVQICLELSDDLQFPCSFILCILYCTISLEVMPEAWSSVQY
jgi:hypothetical protein